jgi:hypothetical protein
MDSWDRRAQTLKGQAGAACRGMTSDLGADRDLGLLPSGPPRGHAATETDHRQPRQPTRKAPETNGSNASQRNQRSRESIDTVGVRSSILRSPTPGGPGFQGLQSFQTEARAALGPHERWLALDAYGSRVAPGGLPQFLRLTRLVHGGVDARAAGERPRIVIEQHEVGTPRARVLTQALKAVVGLHVLGPLARRVAIGYVISRSLFGPRAMGLMVGGSGA